MNNSDTHFPKGRIISNQFLLAWKKLNSSQKGTLISVLVLTLMLPIAIFASYFQNNIRSRAALKPRTYMETPVVNQAVKFPNEETNSSYLVTPPDPDNNGALFDTGSPFTIEAWVKIPKPISGTYIRNYTLLMLTKPQTSTDYGYIFRLTLETQETTGTIRPMFSALKNTYDYINSNYMSVGANNSVTINPDTWTHLAIISYSENDSCNLKLFLNGMLVDNKHMSMSNCAISNQNPQKLFIAKNPDGTGGIDNFYYPGAVDEMRISDIVRYSQNFTPPTTPFESDKNSVALWHFDENMQDSSGHSLHFTNIGTVGYVNVEYPPPATPTAEPTQIETSPSPTITGIPVTPSIKPTKVPSPTAPTITNHPPVITSTFLPKGQVGRSYNAIISGMDQDLGDTLQMDITNLPPGVLNGQCQTTNARVKYIRCLIKGMPTLAGIYPVNVKLTDNFGGVTIKNLSLTIINPNKFDEPQPKE